MPRFRSLFFALLFLYALPGFSQETKKKTPTHLYALKSRADFDLLKGKPLSGGFKGIECIKLVYALSTKNLYYLESKRYRWHYRFTVDVLGETNDLETFNTINYGRKAGKKYLLATFNYNVNTGNYFLQFSSSDNPTDELINTLVDKVATTFFKQKQFKVLLNTTILLSRKKELEQKHSILTSDELFKNQNFQPICKGKTTGILKFIHADSLKQNVDYAAYILVLKGSSNQLPVCKGVITDEFQTPLSHICLLTTNRRTPAAAQKNIFAIDSLKKYRDKMVELNVGDESLSLKFSSAKQDGIKKAKKILKLNADTTVKEIADLNTLSYKQRKSYGSKTCNLAELKVIERRKKNVSTPAGAMGIPFYYYLQHSRNCGADKLIAALVKDSLALNNDSVLDKKLKAIRSLIRKAPLDNFLTTKLYFLCSERFGKNKIRFRSSSNCEDEANFNGAGLYTSQTGIIGDTSKTIELAIKKVWASLWTNRAFKEREFFGIDHTTVCMGVLVHGAFDNEILNGVAITKNLYRSNYDFGFVINMQKGEEEVVSPKPGMVCEQVVSFMNNKWSDFYNTNRSADWLSYSGLNPGASLLSSDELLELTQQLESVKKHFYELYKLWPKVEYKDFGMDVEFKLIETADKKRKFVFKQARPFNN